jgi:hypothetical protein
LFYIIKKAGVYSIWEATPVQMLELSARDRTLNGRLDRAPFRTRADAEARIKHLIAFPPKAAKPA